MVKKQRSINLSDVQWRWLGAEAKRLGISVSDLIRRIVDQCRERHR